MLTRDDKNWISEKLAKEVKPVRDSVDLLRGKITNIHFEKLNLESRMDSIEASTMRTEEKVDKVLNILDGFAGKVAVLEQENKNGCNYHPSSQHSDTGTREDDRHDAFRISCIKTGLSLYSPYTGRKGAIIHLYKEQYGKKAFIQAAWRPRGSQAL